MTNFTYKTIRRHIIPCWYELGWQENPPAIILRIHKDFVKENFEKFNQIKDDAPIVKSLTKKFDFKNFCPNLNENFGFDDAFIHQKTESDFEEYLVFIPKIKKNTGKKCPDCKGKGMNVLFDSECHYCWGTGQESFYDWKKSKAISASFSVISMLLSFSEKNTTAKIPQLMTVQTITDEGMHGGSLGGEFSLFMRTYLASLWKGQQTSINEMVQAMKTTYYLMFEPKIGLTIAEYDIRAGVFSPFGWLNTDCPGNACGLNPAHGAEYEMKEGYGYKFDCHNVDSCAQQLTLLAGLAALHDKARREIKSY